MARPRHKRPASAPAGMLRIIGGSHRGRRLSFPAVDDVRPSPDRVRETLFNWLMPVIRDARCLDLFAGSGALSLEALSRGASSATAVDQSRLLTRNLSTLGEQLGEASRLQVICTDVGHWLSQPPARPFDVIFMDPPFRQGWLDRILPRLASPQWVREGSFIYMEHEAVLDPILPEGWVLHRRQHAGQVTGTLCRVTVNPTPVS